MARGYSLLELIVVLTLLALILSIGGIALGRGGETARVRVAATDLAGALTATRSAAIARGEALSLHLDLETRAYDGPGPIRGRLPELGALTLTTAQRERTGAASGAVRFFPDGSSTGGRIVLGAPPRQRIIEVDWMTGRVNTLPGAQGADRGAG